MIGPYDLSASLGTPGDFDNHEYLDALKKVRQTIPNLQQLAVHIPTNVPKQIDKYREYGIIAVGMDTTILLEGYKELKNA